MSAPMCGVDLETFRLKDVPPTVYYIPNFISEEEERQILENVYSAPKPKWTQLLGRRLQNWGGLPHPKGMIPEKMPEWLDVLIQRLSGLDVFDGKIPNHVLVNEYEAGQGIMPHEDGPLFHPVISTLNIGSYTFLDFYYHISDGTSQAESCAEQERYFMSLFLQPRSLLLIKSDMYNRFLHGIGPKTQDVITDKIGNLGFCDASVGEVMERQRRISLTIRHVPHTLKVKLKLGKT